MLKTLGESFVEARNSRIKSVPTGDNKSQSFEDLQPTPIHGPRRRRPAIATRSNHCLVRKPLTEKAILTHPCGSAGSTQFFQNQASAPFCILVGQPFNACSPGNSAQTACMREERLTGWFIFRDFDFRRHSTDSCFENPEKRSLIRRTAVDAAGSHHRFPSD